MKPSEASCCTYSSICAATCFGVPTNDCRAVVSMISSRIVSPPLAAASSRHEFGDGHGGPSRAARGRG